MGPLPRVKDNRGLKAPVITIAPEGANAGAIAPVEDSHRILLGKSPEGPQARR